MTKSNKWRREFVYFILYIHTASSDHTGNQGRNPKIRNWCRSHEGILLSGLVLVACSVCFLTSQGHLSREGTTHSGLGSSTSIINQENVHTLACISDRVIFLNWGFFFQITLAYIKLTKKKKRITTKTKSNKETVLLIWTVSFAAITLTKLKFA